MPHCGTEGFDDCTWNRPAVWALNSKVRHGHVACPVFSFILVSVLTLITGQLPSMRLFRYRRHDHRVLLLSRSAASKLPIKLFQLCLRKRIPVLLAPCAGGANSAVWVQLPRGGWERGLRGVRHRGSGHRRRPRRYDVHDGVRLQGNRCPRARQILQQAIGKEWVLVERARTVFASVTAAVRFGRAGPEVCILLSLRPPTTKTRLGSQPMDS